MRFAGSAWVPLGTIHATFWSRSGPWAFVPKEHQVLSGTHEPPTKGQNCGDFLAWRFSHPAAHLNHPRCSENQPVPTPKICFPNSADPPPWGRAFISVCSQTVGMRPARTAGGLGESSCPSWQRVRVGPWHLAPPQLLSKGTAGVSPFSRDNS